MKNFQIGDMVRANAPLHQGNDVIVPIALRGQVIDYIKPQNCYRIKWINGVTLKTKGTYISKCGNLEITENIN